jgi:AcrR family transcriptional regulator
VAVAERSGVAKTAIYRRYPDRDDLLQATLRTITHRGAPSAELRPQGELRWVLEQARDVLATGVDLGGVAAVLTDRARRCAVR